jgi:hypothetical protein
VRAANDWASWAYFTQQEGAYQRGATAKPDEASRARTVKLRS